MELIGENERIWGSHRVVTQNECERPACARGTHSTSTVFSPRSHSYLPNSIGEDVDDLLMWCGYDTLAIDFNDPMSHADPSSLSDSPSHEAADLPEVNSRLHLVGSATSLNLVGVEDGLPWGPQALA